MGTTRKLLMAAGAAVALGAGAGAAQALTSDEDDVRATGPDAEKAKAAALRAVGGGRVVGVERENEASAAWEVEIVRADGREVETKLNRSFKPTAVDDEDDDSGRDDDDGAERDDDNDSGRDDD